jgi:hypothetical protein
MSASGEECPDFSTLMNGSFARELPFFNGFSNGEV